MSCRIIRKVCNFSTDLPGLDILQFDKRLWKCTSLPLAYELLFQEFDLFGSVGAFGAEVELDLGFGAGRTD